MNNKKDMLTVIKRFYQCRCSLSFLNNDREVIIEAKSKKAKQEIDPVESQKILNLAGFNVKYLAVKH